MTDGRENVPPGCGREGAPKAVSLWGVLLGLTAVTTMAAGFLMSSIVASQSVPVIALAPLLIVWFSFGVASKVLVAALAIFFTVLNTNLAGQRSIEVDLIDLMRSLRASKWQASKYLEVPAAIPTLFGGLKVGVTLSIIGAVAGEFAQSDRGLGFLANLANRGLFDTSLMFETLFALMTIAWVLNGLVSVAEGLVLGRRRDGALSALP